MGIVEETIGRLRSSSASAEQLDAVAVARELLEKAAITDADPVVLANAGDRLGWCTAVREATVSVDDSAKLQRALISLVDEPANDPEVGEAIFALSKCVGSPTLVEFGRRVLLSALVHDPVVLHQTLVALENWGEDLGKCSRSVADVKVNREIAASYLKDLET